MNACTIVARNYFAHARVLAASFVEHNPGHAFHILLLDGADAGFPDGPDGVEVVRLDQIGLDTAEVHRMLAIYDVRELATAVKPWLLRTLRDRSGEVVVYLDPDIQVFGSLEEVVPLATEHGIVLTPHSSEPMAHDARIPNEPFIRQAGVFNLGFIAIGPGTDPFLDWWSERLRRDCVIDVERGLFVDQSWIDLVPCYFDHHVLKDPGYNVAYWNLHTRKISSRGDRFMVDGRPLVFFHFSGFSPDAPYALTKYAGDIPRVLLSENEVAWDLCESYGESLARQGFAELSAIPYGYDTLTNGLKLDSRMRRIYRDAVYRRRGR